MLIKIAYKIAYNKSLKIYKNIKNLKNNFSKKEKHFLV
jgi:hypothetical protein